MTLNTIIDTKNNNKLDRATVANKYVLIPYEDFTGYTKEEITNFLPVLSLSRVKIA